MHLFDPVRQSNVTEHGNLQAAETMVFVHGFGSDQTVWRDVVSAYCRDYRILLLDLAGFGGSAAGGDTSRYVTLRGYVDDLLAVGQTLALENAILVGHSVGAMIALLAASRHPGMFGKLVLLGASPRYLNDTDYYGGFTEKAIGEIHLAMTTNYLVWAGAFSARMVGNADRPALAAYFAEHLKAIPIKRAASILLSILRADHRGDLARVAVPTLIIQSRDDPAVPIEVAEYLQRHIRDSRLRVIDTSGHLPHISAPAAVIAAMNSFGLHGSEPAGHAPVEAAAVA